MSCPHTPARHSRHSSVQLLAEAARTCGIVSHKCLPALGPLSSLASAVLQSCPLWPLEHPPKHGEDLITPIYTFPCSWNVIKGFYEVGLFKFLGSKYLCIILQIKCSCSCSCANDESNRDERNGRELFSACASKSAPLIRRQ